jgi:hypothetical protein
VHYGKEKIIVPRTMIPWISGGKTPENSRKVEAVIQ